MGLSIVAVLTACNGTSQGGTIDDGKPVDSSGKLNDKGGPVTDTGVENKTRTDIQQRDTFTTKGQ